MVAIHVEIVGIIEMFKMFGCFSIREVFLVGFKLQYTIIQHGFSELPFPFCCCVVIYSMSACMPS